MLAFFKSYCYIMTSSRRIYLNTSDILNGDSDNHADCQFDLSKAGIDINNNQQISIALCQVQIPQTISYIRYSGIDYLFNFGSAEIPTAAGLNPLTPPNLATCFIAFTNNILQPPIIVNNAVICAIPFSYSNNPESLINVMNQCLSARMSDGNINSRFITSPNNFLESDGPSDLFFQNKYWQPELNFNVLFKKESQKIARMLGINYKTTDTLTRLSVTEANRLNRDNNEIFPIGMSGDSLLVSTNQSLDSYSSVGNGINNILSSVPIQLGVSNEYMTISKVVDGGDTTTLLDKYRNGFIYHKNKNISESHKTISAIDINNFRLTITDSNYETLFVNNNILYEIEVIYNF